MRQGKIHIEHIDDLDILVLCGKDSDVVAVQKVMENLDRNAANADAGNVPAEPAERTSGE